MEIKVGQKYLSAVHGIALIVETSVDFKGGMKNYVKWEQLPLTPRPRVIKWSTEYFLKYFKLVTG